MINFDFTYEQWQSRPLEDALQKQVDDLQRYKTNNENFCRGLIKESIEAQVKNTNLLSRLREAREKINRISDTIGITWYGAYKAEKILDELFPELNQKEEEKWIPHVVKEGSRKHVLSYDSNGAHCSEPDCIYNKPKEEVKDERSTTQSPASD
jgi:hypothetical protein